LDDPRQVTAIGVGAVVIAACVPVAGIEDGPVLCPFRRLTGLPCPACGLTRSFVYTMHGHLAEGFQAHFFGPLLVLAIAVGAVLLATRMAGRRSAAVGRPSVRRPAERLTTRAKYPLIAVIVTAWSGYAVARMAGIVG